MWMLTFLLTLCTLALGWVLFGPLLTTGTIRWFRRNGAPPLPETYPTLSVIVPVHNAERTIAGKIRNLMACDYPRGQLEVLLVDGASTDATLPQLMRALRKGWPVRVFRLKSPDRIGQINHALSVARGEFVVVTDADVRVRPDALKWLVAHLAYDSACSVAGAYHHVQPELSREGCLASLRSRMRLIESDAGLGQQVSRTCYAFRRTLSPTLPDDVTADEIYLARLAQSRRQRVHVSRFAVAESVNRQSSLAALTARCFRDNLASLREGMRALHRTAEMSPGARFFTWTHLTRQLLLVPLACGFVTLAMARATMGEFAGRFAFDHDAWNVVTTCMVGLAASAFASYRILGTVTIPPGAGRRNTRWLRFDVLAAVVTGLCVSGVWYWFAGSRRKQPTVQSAAARSPVNTWPDDDRAPETSVTPDIEPLIAAVATTKRQTARMPLVSGRIDASTRLTPSVARLTPSGCL